MLKIKDNVDLKELEKYGFKKLIIAYTKRVYLGNDNDDRVFYGIGIEDRIIRIVRLDRELDNTLYDLIKDGLVEKVEG
jgi:hypothetical protein